MLAPKLCLCGPEPLELEDDVAEMFVSGNARQVLGLEPAGVKQPYKGRFDRKLVANRCDVPVQRVRDSENEELVMSSGIDAPRLGAMLILLLLACRAHAAEAPALAIPIACTLGQDCFIQQYVDIDPGAGARDYTCGSATYDGHKGTDFRVRTMADVARGVPVLASAAGTVKGVRDGVPDRLVLTAADRKAVEGRECGNGVLVDHGGGWETQYCHMRRGSVSVARGQTVKAGQPIGLVGASGHAQFPHVHISVRHRGKVIDPFASDQSGGACGVQEPASLWQEGIRDRLGYGSAQPLMVGFASGPVKSEALVRSLPPSPTADAPAIVAYGWVINLRKGDRLRIALDGPAGRLAENTIPAVDRAKAQYVAFSGRKRPAGGWPTGTYTALLEVIRNGVAVRRESKVLELR